MFSVAGFRRLPKQPNDIFAPSSFFAPKAGGSKIYEPQTPAYSCFQPVVLRPYDRMTNTIIGAAGLWLVSLTVCVPQALAAPAHTSCASLTAMKLPDTTIAAAEEVTGGALSDVVPCVAFLRISAANGHQTRRKSDNVFFSAR